MIAFICFSSSFILFFFNIMQIERLFANSTVSKKRRPSYITVNSVSPSSVETLLSTRTAKSISKSRRSSLVAEVLGSSPSSERTTSTNGCPDVGVLIGSRRSSLINVVYDKSSFPEGEYNFPPTDESMNGDNETPSDFFLDHPYEQLDPIPSFPSSPITQPPSSTERAPRSRSLSITPIIQETSSMHISKTVHLDDHTMYKVKKKRPSSSDTVASNPALSAQEDVPIQDIKTDGLSAMLDSKVPLCYFLHHLLEEYSSENLVRCLCCICKRRGEARVKMTPEFYELRHTPYLSSLPSSSFWSYSNTIIHRGLSSSPQPSIFTTFIYPETVRLK